MGKKRRDTRPPQQRTRTKGHLRSVPPVHDRPEDEPLIQSLRTALRETTAALHVIGARASVERPSSRNRQDVGRITWSPEQPNLSDDDLGLLRGAEVVDEGSLVDGTGRGQPVMITEMGGVSFAPGAGEEWCGYSTVGCPEEPVEGLRAALHRPARSDPASEVDFSRAAGETAAHEPGGEG